MKIDQLQRHWERLAQDDPRWAILSDDTKLGNRWADDEFFATGEADMARVYAEARHAGVTLPTGRALDFGCGQGRLTQAMASHFTEVDGVDIAPSMIERARELNRHGARVRYHLNERPDLSIFPDASFDFVYSFITLQHMEPRYSMAYMAEFVRLLTPGGLAVFHMPYALRARRLRERAKHAAPWAFALLAGLRGKPAAVMEAHPIPRASVIAHLQAAGGRVVHVQDGLGNAAYPGAHYFVRRAVRAA